ncbi:hypothetical protein ACFQ0B_31230 [Nonomuraea thailandensis]
MEYLVGVAVVAVLVGVPSIVWWRVMRGRRELGTSPAERATFETLHTASLAGPPLRAASPPTAPSAPRGTCARCSARPPWPSPTSSACSCTTATATTTTPSRRSSTRPPP